MEKKTITILTGAGISQESGIKTFRDSNGLWEEHKVEDVASPKGWLSDPSLVLEFYNQRRRQIKECEPNEAHKQLVRLEEKYIVNLITQNVDDLHERAGSKRILHLHGQLTQAKSSGNESNVKDIGYEDIKLGDLCEEGFQMRPNIVWFGESVPMILTAEGLAYDSDIFIVIDPNDTPLFGRKGFVTFIKKSATEGVKELVDQLMAD